MERAEGVVRVGLKPVLKAGFVAALGLFFVAFFVANFQGSRALWVWLCISAVIILWALFDPSEISVFENGDLLLRSVFRTVRVEAKSVRELASWSRLGLRLRAILRVDGRSPLVLSESEEELAKLARAIARRNPHVRVDKVLLELRSVEENLP